MPPPRLPHHRVPLPPPQPALPVAARNRLTFQWPTSPVLQRASLLVIHGLTEGWEHAQTAGWWWPMSRYAAPGVQPQWVVPLSCWPWLAQSGCTPHDEQTRHHVRGYLDECRVSMGPGAALLPAGVVYPWASLLSSEWRPYDYQLAGMERLYARARWWHHGCLLGDDVGLGKTVQAIGLAERLRAEGLIDRVLVCTTASTKGQWGDEITRFALSKPPVCVLAGSKADKVRKAGALPAAGYVVLNHDMLRNPSYATQLRAWVNARTMLAFDEASVYANPTGKTRAAAVQLARAAHTVLSFNATPIENGLQDMWGQVDLIDPNVLGEWERFAQRYLHLNPYTGRASGVREMPEARTRIRGVILRRTRADLGGIGPKVVSQVRLVELDPEHAAAYRACVQTLPSASVTGAVALASIAKVQRAALCADITNPGSVSAKLDDLVGLMQGELASERLVLFTRLATTAHWAHQRLRSCGYYPWIITGATPEAERTDIQRRFSDPQTAGRVLVGTDAMCRGLNLQAAGVVVNLDLPWTAARLRQRVGRIDRLSQLRPTVLALNYVATLPGGRPTVDGYFLQTVLKKQGVFDDFFGSDGVDSIGDSEAGLHVQPVLDYIRGGAGLPTAPPRA